MRKPEKRITMEKKRNVINVFSSELIRVENNLRGGDGPALPDAPRTPPLGTRRPQNASHVLRTRLCLMVHIFFIGVQVFLLKWPCMEGFVRWEGVRVRVIFVVW